MERDDGSDFAGMSEDEEYHQECQGQLRALGFKIQQQLLEGQEISDEIYVDLFVNKLRRTYQYKSPISKRKEIKTQAARQVEINSRINEITAQLASEDLQKKVQKKLNDEQGALEQELSKMD